jgi:hypothetical protein
LPHVREGAFWLAQVLEYVAAEDNVKGLRRQRIALEIADNRLVELFVPVHRLAVDVEPNDVGAVSEVDRGSRSAAGLQHLDLLPNPRREAQAHDLIESEMLLRH